jgi:MFS family permease
MMDLLATIAVVLQLVSLNTVVLGISRFLMGFYCGIISGVVPSYILSLSPSFTSGIVGTYNQVAMALGMAFAYYMGQLLDDNSFAQITAVRILIGFPLVCIFVHIVVLFLHPYDNIERHIQRRENNIVRKYLKTVYGANWRVFEAEIQQHKVIPIESEQPNKSTRDIYDEENFESQQQRCKCTKFNFVLLAVMLAVANQLSGITAVL